MTQFVPVINLDLFNYQLDDWFFYNQLVTASVVFHVILFIALSVLVWISIVNKKEYINYIQSSLNKKIPKFVNFMMATVIKKLSKHIILLKFDALYGALWKKRLHELLNFWTSLIIQRWILGLEIALLDPTKVMLKRSKTYFRQKDLLICK
ncbi:hypothetical protein [Ureaplasma ceti]|uniref:Uncharacterized protein n=1 Tax=Ureaplasma ceti TaxID=3119530 RepID=A0ABP9U682_9BACT